MLNINIIYKYIISIPRDKVNPENLRFSLFQVGKNMKRFQIGTERADVAKPQIVQIYRCWNLKALVTPENGEVR